MLENNLTEPESILKLKSKLKKYRRKYLRAKTGAPLVGEPE